MRNLHSNHHTAQALEQQPFVLVLLYDMHVVCNIMPTVENYCTIKEAIKQLRFHYDNTSKTHLLFLCNLLHNPDILCSFHMSVSNSVLTSLSYVKKG